MSQFKAFKQARINHAMSKHNLDILISSLPQNTLYVTDFFPMGQTILSNVEEYSLYDIKTGAKALVCSVADAPTIIESADYTEIYPCGKFVFSFTEQEDSFNKLVKEAIAVRYASPLEALKVAVKKYAIGKVRIGLDESMMPAPSWINLVNSFPEIEFVPAASIFAEARMIKHPNEVCYLEKAAKISEDSLTTILPAIVPGISEYEIGELYINEVTKRGALPIFHVVTCDKRAAFSDTDNLKTNKVGDNSILRIDFGCIYNNYRADIARTVATGKPSQKAVDYYQYILEGTEKAIDAIKEGVLAEDIFKIAVETVQKGMPFYERHHCGHGIGLEIYDPPSIALGCKAELQENMVLCIETPYYELGWSGVQVEDTIVVQKDGVKKFTHSPAEIMRAGY